MRTYKFFVFVLILVFLGSCSPQKRFTKLIEKHPYLITSDTVKILDTVRVNIPAVQVDTVLKIDQLTDTVTIIKEHYKTKVWRVRDSVFISGGCDTIRVEKIIERRIPVKYYEKKKTNVLLYVGFVLLICLVILHLLKRIKFL
jgi:hypothetical protein